MPFDKNNYCFVLFCFALQCDVHRRSIRFGEYNIETEEDCMPSRIPSGQILKCADPVVEVGVEKIIVHPDYNDKSRGKMHDIALIRLNTNVTYSKYIKPICLPVAGLSSGLITGNKLSVAGWGTTNGMHFSHTTYFSQCFAGVCVATNNKILHSSSFFVFNAVTAFISSRLNVEVANAALEANGQKINNK